MTAVDQFADSAATDSVTVTRVPADDTADAIANAVEPPAVGVALPWDDVALPDEAERDPSTPALEAARTGVTPAAFAVADYGSLGLAATPDGSEPVSLYVDRHVAVLRAEDVLPDMAAAFDRLETAFRETRGSTILATGPSATADMGALVTGAHGPKEVHIIIAT